MVKRFWGSLKPIETKALLKITRWENQHWPLQVMLKSPLRVPKYGGDLFLERYPFTLSPLVFVGVS